MAHHAVILTERKSKLAMLKKEMESAEARYLDLKQKYEELLGEIEGHLAPPPPISRLPLDIMQEIFLYCLPRTHNAVISTRECPLVITHVCSAWRSVALNAPALWASIYIPIPNVPDSLHKKLALETAQCRRRAVMEWLGRSGGCTLSITLYKSMGPTYPEVEDVIIDALLPFAERWGTFICESIVNLKRIAALPASALPRLHTVSLSAMPPLVPDGDPYDSNPSDQWKDSGMMRAPRLTSVAYSLSTEDFAHFHQLPFAQLTSLSLHAAKTIAGRGFSSVDKLATILSLCPCLRYCYLEIPGRNMDFPDDSDTDDDPSLPALLSALPKSIHLPQLTSLTLEVLSYSPDVAALISTLTVPVLKELKCYGHGANALDALVPTTAHTLRKLTLDPYFLTRGKLYNHLCACTELEALLFISFDPMRHWPPSDNEDLVLDFMDRYTYLEDRFLKLLSPSSKDSDAAAPAILPRLSHFECDVEFEGLSDTAVLLFLYSRARQLKWVRIMLRREKQLPMASDIEKLAKLGVKCHLCYRAPAVRPHFSPSDGVGI